MVALFYSDTHLRDIGSFGPYNEIGDQGITKELNNMILGYCFVADSILRLKPKVVINCGDTFQNSQFQTAQVLHGADQAFTKIRQACLEVGARHFIIPGNHDILNMHKMITSISLLKHYGEVVLLPTTIDVDGASVVFLPYDDNIPRVYSNLLSAQAYDLIVTHQDFSGCVYESGLRSDSGLDPSFLKTKVISGDIHLPQDIGNVSYVGSLVQHKFNRYNLDKIGGILTYDFNTKVVTRYKNQYSKHYVKVTNIKDGLSLDPKRVLLQVVSDLSKEEINEMFKSYDHTYMREIKEQTESRQYSDVNVLTPDVVLRTHIYDEKPDILDYFDKVVKSKGDSNVQNNGND